MEYTLVGKFLGARLDIDTLKNMLKKKWVIHSQVDIAPMANRFLSFVFNYKEDMNMVLCGGPWMFGKSTLMVKKWEPNMDLIDAFFLTTPIWV